MSVDPQDLRSGSIVWAMVRDRNGYRKRRPAVVLTPTEDIASDQPLTVMAITTTFPSPTPRNCIDLPWNADRRKVSTGLARRSAAVLDWLDTIYPDEVDGIIGVLPASRLTMIYDRLRELNNG